MDIPSRMDGSSTEQPSVRSDRSSVSAELSQRLDALRSLSSEAPRMEWRRLYRSHPPRLSRDLLIRALAYRLQELAYGGLSKDARRRLKRFAEQLKADGHLSIEREHRLLPGQRLIREWHGKTHTITVLDRGYFYNGSTYSSLSAIASLISGAHWSGPRFFGLKSGKRSKSSSRSGTAEETAGVDAMREYDAR